MGSVGNTCTIEIQGMASVPTTLNLHKNQFITIYGILIIKNFAKRGRKDPVNPCAPLFY
ncbi:hypothetical protein YDYSY3_41130 [Paenibacillus chitinolyticus]|nr:hypothetical protein YDYSY3_41130 [Paenibacillus chitinolyticus]